MIRSETMQANQWKALGRNSYHWVLGPGSVFLPRAGDSRAVGLRQRCEEQRGSPGLSTEGLSKEWRHAGHFLAMLTAVHLLSLSPGTLVHNPSSASQGHCDWLLNECISHLEKRCLLPQSVAISWVFGSCPSDCSSHLHGSEILCRSWQCSQQHHLFFFFFWSIFHAHAKVLVLPAGTDVLLDKEHQSYYYVSVTLQFLNASHMLTFRRCRLFYQVGWGLWVSGLESFVGRVGWNCRTTKKPKICVSSFIPF